MLKQEHVSTGELYCVGLCAVVQCCVVWWWWFDRLNRAQKYATDRKRSTTGYIWRSSAWHRMTSVFFGVLLYFIILKLVARTGEMASPAAVSNEHPFRWDARATQVNGEAERKIVWKVANFRCSIDICSNGWMWNSIVRVCCIHHAPCIFVDSLGDLLICAICQMSARCNVAAPGQSISPDIREWIAPINGDEPFRRHRIVFVQHLFG